MNIMSEFLDSYFRDVVKQIQQLNLRECLFIWSDRSSVFENICTFICYATAFILKSKLVVHYCNGQH